MFALCLGGGVFTDFLKARIELGRGFDAFKFAQRFVDDLFSEGRAWVRLIGCLYHREAIQMWARDHELMGGAQLVLDDEQYLP
jgi:hypothetical protein